MSTKKPARAFTHSLAKRGPTQMLFGLIGPSSGGKTFSALRLASGMQRILKGETFLIDTEANRALHYADRFRFQHVPFEAPFGSLDYLAAIDYCVEQGANIVIVDSMSHEHEGPGGYLDYHDEEVERLKVSWKTDSAEKVNFPAYRKPSEARQRLINSMVQRPVHFLLCFRAKERNEMDTRGNKTQIVKLGFMPIGGPAFQYELVGSALLLPGADGVPTWQPENKGEREMVKLPIGLRDVFSGEKGEPLSEEHGEQLAIWSQGGPAALLETQYDACTNAADFDKLEDERRELWPKLAGGDRQRLKTAADKAAERTRVGGAGAKSEPKRDAGDVYAEQSGARRAPADETDDSIRRGFRKSLEAAKDIASLDAVWRDVVDQYGSDCPLELDAKYAEMREALDT